LPENKNKLPTGKVPALELPKEKDPLIESLVIADYLDEKYPQAPLHSKDPLRKAQDRILIERFGAVTSALYRLFMSVDGAPPGTLTEIVNGLDTYESELKSRGTPFFGGKTIGMLDLMIWPWCERSDMIRILVGDKYELDKERFEHLVSVVVKSVTIISTFYQCCCGFSSSGAI
jgi:pyrimidodiazepine synthase